MSEKKEYEMNTEEVKGETNENTEDSQMMWLPIGMCLGVSIGMAMGSLIFAPVFFDFGSLFPIFKLLEHLFLPAYFLNSFFVSGYYALGMFLGGGIFLLLGIRLERLRQL